MHFIKGSLFYLLIHYVIDNFSCVILINKRSILKEMLFRKQVKSSTKAQPSVNLLYSKLKKLYHSQSPHSPFLIADPLTPGLAGDNSPPPWSLASPGLVTLMSHHRPLICDGGVTHHILY